MLHYKQCYSTYLTLRLAQRLQEWVGPLELLDEKDAVVAIASKRVDSPHVSET